MSALDFLGGIGLGYNYIQNGLEHAQDRTFTLEQREEQKRLQEYQRSQRQRLLDEQARADAKREKIANMPTEEAVDDPSATQAIPQQPQSDASQPPIQQPPAGDGMQPSAAPMPALQPVAQPKKMRQMLPEDQFARLAEIHKADGDTENFLKFQNLSIKASHERAGAMFNQWSASLTPDTPLLQAANQAASIYNSDKLPGMVRVQPNQDGSVTAFVTNKLSGQTGQLVVKNVEELRRSLQGYFRPEAYEAYLKAVQEYQLKREDNAADVAGKIAVEQAKGQVVPAGAAYIPGRGSSQQPMVNDTGFIEDANGNLVRPGGRGTRGDGTGTGSGGQNKGRPVIADTFKGNEGMIAAANEIHSALIANNPNMPPESADGIAVRAASGQGVTKTFNPTTGRFDLHFDDKPQVDPKTGKPNSYATGKRYMLGSDEYRDGGQITPEEAKAGVADLQKRSPEQFAQYAAAAKLKPEEFAKAQQDKQGAYLNSKIPELEKLAEARKAAEASGNRQEAAALGQRMMAIKSEADRVAAQFEADARKVALVRHFYTPPKDSQSAKIASPGGLGAAIPQYAVQQAQQNAAAADKQRADAQEAAALRARQEEEARQQVAGLTVDIAKSLSKDDAKKIYNKYGRYIKDTAVLRELQRVAGSYQSVLRDQPFTFR